TKRFKASLTVPGAVFMLTRAPEGNGNVLLQIDKDSGQPRSRVDLGKEREPVYAVDDVANMLFLRTTAGTLVGYRLWSTMRASRWTTNVVCAGLLGAVLSGCKSREDAFRAAKVPVIRFDSVLKAADSVRVPLADARLLLDVAGDSGFALKAPHDTMTVTDILAWARAEQARKAQVNAAALAADRARRDSVRKLLEPLLVVTVVKKTYLPRDPDSEQYEDYISLAFAYQN